MDPEFHEGDAAGVASGSYKRSKSRDGELLVHFIRSYEMGVAISFILRGVDVNVRDDQGMTALHHAALRGMRDVVRELVKSRRCDYLARDLNGRYAFELAITGARDYALARLLQRKQVQQATSAGLPAYRLGEE